MRKTSGKNRGETRATTVAKRDLPTKTCPVCGRPFAWRKSWARVWEEVRYCSERCRRAPKAPTRPVSAS